MTNTVYTNYWVNENTGVHKEHGTYLTEEDAKRGIEAWWELHGESYPDLEEYRTNTGAWEIKYGHDYYFYRIEKRQVSQPLKKPTYSLKSQQEIESLRKKYNLSQEELLFDELAEPYRDRLVMAYNDIEALQGQVYNELGQPIKKINNK